MIECEREKVKGRRSREKRERNREREKERETRLFIANKMKYIYYISFTKLQKSKENFSKLNILYR